MKQIKIVFETEISKAANGFVLTQWDPRNDLKTVNVFTDVNDLCAFIIEIYSEKEPESHV